MIRRIALSLLVLGIATPALAAEEKSPKTLKNDPVAAIRSSLPKGWAILKVEENAYPSLRREGKGKAIYLYSPQQSIGPMQDKASVVYIMPADYDGGEDTSHGQSQRFPAALILTTPTAKVYLLGNETSLDCHGMAHPDG